MIIGLLATFITGVFASASASQVLSVFVTNFPKTHLGQEPASLVTLRCQGSPVIARELFCTRSHSDGTIPENFTVPVGSVLVVKVADVDGVAFKDEHLTAGFVVSPGATMMAQGSNLLVMLYGYLVNSG